MSYIQPEEYQSKAGKIILVRSGLPTDAQETATLARSVFQEGDFNVSTLAEWTMSIAQEAAWIRNHNDEFGKVIIVAEADDKVIGMLNFQNGLRKRLAHQGLLGMSVQKEWRNQGVGRALLMALIVWGEKHPLIEKLRLEVFSTNQRAIHLYAALGFQEEGRLAKQVKINRDEYVDLLLMSKFVK